MANIIIAFVHCMCFIAFLLVANTGSNSYPISFWSGGNKKLTTLLKDIPSYNKEMKQLFTIYASIYLLGAVTSLFSIEISIGIMLFGCSIGIVLVGLRYHKIRKKYS